MTLRLVCALLALPLVADGFSAFAPPSRRLAGARVPPLLRRFYTSTSTSPSTTSSTVMLAAASADVVAAEQEAVLACAVEAARAAGELIRAGRGAAVRKTKANPRDLLTEVDGQCQAVIEARVAAAFPSHGFLGEESVAAGQAASSAALAAATATVNDSDSDRDGDGDGSSSSSSSSSSGGGGGGGDWLWVVDPIDGTTNFASGLTLSAVSIGVAHRGAPSVGVIYDPFLDEMFTAMAGRGAFCNGEAIRCNGNGETQGGGASGAAAAAAGGGGGASGGAAETAAEASEDAAALGDAVVFAGSPPAMNSMLPSLRGVNALMPKVRTIRMVGSAALMFAWVAAGRASAYFEADLNAWDVAAGAVLIHEAGGSVVDMADPYGAPYGLATRRILATNGDPVLLRALHRELAAVRATRLEDDAE